ncbi:MAG: GreA/GreB family elongation factor [Desulfobulbus sp.]|jgi:transcription elongation GreA/GreB family factor|uniref:GreA/GreB family elongation factor n=1 Tax=Desulfobulbus sp. TaxID=895 RepID=UPI002841F4E1|nr:GreA/GreB family elongation factor [Desulfobulbus sp.]MDR2549801.1 GreA/GreB family elongation factor [Desulfobulbus sp.]
MAETTVCITESDKKRIEQLMLFCDIFREQERKSIRRLHFYAAQGRVVGAGEMPEDVAAPRSHVVLQETATGREFGVTPVFPEEADAHLNPVSLLTPMGVALMGRKAGETIEERTAGGVRTLIIKSVSRPLRF